MITLFLIGLSYLIVHLFIIAVIYYNGGGKSSNRDKRFNSSHYNPHEVEVERQLRRQTELLGKQNIDRVTGYGQGRKDTWSGD